MHTRKWTNSLGALLAGLVISTPACAAAYFSPLVGGSGGSNYTRNCGVMGVLVGIQTRYGWWLDQMTPVCREFRSDGSLGNTFTLPRIGGTGGNDVKEIACSTGVMVGLVVKWGTYINMVQLECSPWDAASKTRGSLVQVTFFAGGISGIPKETKLRCPAGQIAKGLKGKAAKYVDSLSLICNLWNQ